MLTLVVLSVLCILCLGFVAAVVTCMKIDNNSARRDAFFDELANTSLDVDTLFPT